jgi:endonuclease/exonuclease/phosphatase family metal-dependent hydrolase
MRSLGYNTTLHLLISAATPPVFDGPEDRNGRRNADETVFWTQLLNGAIGVPAPPAPFVLIGQPNLDPHKGQGNRASLNALLSDPKLQDPKPRGVMGHEAFGGEVFSAGDTWVSKTGWGLRLDMVLPSSDLKVTGAGVLWPAPSDPLAAVLETASDHRPVWVTIALP